MGYEVWIYTNKKPPKYRHGSNSLYIYVVELKPYDGLSKRFKKYTHTIQYTEQGKYVPSDYYFQIYNPNGGHYSKYIFKYKHPLFKLKAVYIFFKNDDSNNNVPLILGFDQESFVPVYFTYNYLCDFTNRWYGYYEKPVNLPTGSFKESDLLTRLLEEIGPSVGRERKFVIRLNEKPNNNSTYPESGHNPKKITVKKENFTDVAGYDKYEHIIPGDVGGGDGFYVSYNRDSKRIVTDSGLGSGYGSLSKVSVYYKTVTGGRGSGNPVLITFSFTGKTGKLYVYSYQDFVNDLKRDAFVNPKTISESDAISDRGGSGSDLLRILREESDKLKQITFLTRDPGSSDSSGHKNITIGRDEDVGPGVGGEKFVKVTMTPDIGSAKDGPWNVYNSTLFDLGSGKKMKATFSGIINNSKYSSISVYYSTKGGDSDGNDDKALLVEFDDYGDKTYFKREDRDRTKWAITHEIRTGARDTRGGGGDMALLPILEAESERLKELIEFVKGDDRSNNVNISKGQEEDVPGNEETFKKISMTPNTKDAPGVQGGSSVGPWTVYNTKLISKELGIKIAPDRILDNIITGDVANSRSKKYSSITVYYAVTNTDSGQGSTDEYMALLVEFVLCSGSSSGTKKYIKRGSRDGNQWADATDEIRTTGGDEGSDRALLRVLKDQWNKLRPLITFKLGSGGGHKNITTTGPTDFTGGSESFKKVTFKPNTGDGGSSKGPWEVYSNKLIDRGFDRGNEIQPESVLQSITGSSNKYSSITVYYTSNLMALLVEFCAGEGSRKYIKIEKGSRGSRWANADDISSRIAGGGCGTTSDGDRALAEVLSGVSREAFNTISSSSTVSRGDSSSSSPEPSGPISGNSRPGLESPAGPFGEKAVRAEPGPVNTSSQRSKEDMSTGTKAGIGTGVGVGGVGAGVGFAIYKYPQLFLSLIGK